MASDLLQVPKVEKPVAALTSVALLPTDAIDCLRPDDRKAELSFCKAHQAEVWAVKAATSASFFNRASQLWLHQMQEQISPEDVKVHQDINKLVAAAEFSADATLNAAKFASRSIASSITTHHLLWLKHWQADNKNKWKLASAPFTGNQLF